MNLNPWEHSSFDEVVVPGMECKFMDDRWKLPVYNPAESNSDLRWDTVLKRSMRADDTAQLIRSFKCFIWALLRPRSGNSFLRPSSIRAHFFLCRPLFRWLYQNGHTSLGTVDQKTIGAYLRHIKTSKLTIVQKANRLSVLVKLYQERERLPIGNRIEFHPFAGLTAGVLIGSRRGKQGEHPALPDELAFGLFAKAQRVICEFSEYAIDIASQRSALGLNKYKIEKLIKGYSWPTNLRDHYSLPGGHAVNRLISDVYIAAAVLILLCVGPRIHELLSFSIGCLSEPVRSDDGTLEIFYLKGRTIKSAPFATGVERQWVAAARPTGSSEEPIVVKAIRVLEKLHEGGNCSDPYLIRSARSGVRLRGGHFRAALSRFFPDSPRIIPHSFRKTYARFLAQTANTLSPLAQQFGHTRLAHTMRYVGNDSDLNALVDEAAADELAGAMVDLWRAPATTGKAAERVRPALASLRATVASEEEFIEIVRRLTRSTDIQIHPAPWGVCYFRSDTAPNCKGTDAPNYVLRAVEICASCENFSASNQYQPYHSNRSREYRRLLENYPHAPSQLRDYWEGAAKTSDSIVAGLTLAS